MVPRQRPRPHRPQPPSPPHDIPRDRRAEVETTQGLRAGLAVFARRRDEVLRVAYARGVRPELGEIIRWCASQRIPCQELSDAELDRVAESTHHEGLCVAARPRRWLSTSELADALTRTQGKGGCGIALDRVRNPYNVGAILRSAAFFGMDGLLLGAPAPHASLAPTAVRVAEGGTEHLHLARTTDLADTLARLRARGIRVVGTDARTATGAVGFAFGRPVVLVVGNEREGLADRVRTQCDAVVAVRGSGMLDSLNVAVATGVLMAEMTKEYGEKS
jgi:RNA methyltransferase, TrmH family